LSVDLLFGGGINWHAVSKGYAATGVTKHVGMCSVRAIDPPLGDGDRVSAKNKGNQSSSTQIAHHLHKLLPVVVRSFMRVVRNATAVEISGLACLTRNRHLATKLWNMDVAFSVRGVDSSFTLNRCSAAGVLAVCRICHVRRIIATCSRRIW
jgi:hypothetical protein